MQLTANIAIMGIIYVVIENGDPYPVAYTTYDQAVMAVKLKHKEYLEKEKQWEDENGVEYSINEVDVPEEKEGPSYLYIEKEIHIEIHRLPVV